MHVTTELPVEALPPAVLYPNLRADANDNEPADQYQAAQDQAAAAPQAPDAPVSTASFEVYPLLSWSAHLGAL